MRYVDRRPAAELLREHPEVGASIAVVDVVDDGERIDSVPDGSVDFVVANHFIEHCEDPLAAIRAQLRVLRSGGRSFMAVPDPRRSFDRDRPWTSWEHVVRDYESGPEASRSAHYEEWMRLVERVDAEHLAARAGYAEEIGRRIHFHVWGRREFDAMLAGCATELGFPLEVEAVRPNLSEYVAIFTRTGAALPPAPR